MNWTIQKYVGDIQDICIEKGIRDNSNLEISEVTETYIDNLYGNSDDEIEDVCATFDAIMANIDYGYIKEAVSESKYTKMQMVSLTERDFM